MLRLLVLLMCSLFPSFAWADLRAPMRFALMEDCNEGRCEQVGLGVGAIEGSAHDALVKFVEAHPKIRRIYFHSPGGDLSMALKMGIYLREAGLDTALTSKMRCYSACAYTFLGGVARSIQEGGAIGVHQFYTKDGSGSLQEGQRAHSTLVQYTRAMGVSETLVDIAVQAGQDEMMKIGAGRARILRVDNAHPSPSEWSLTSRKGKLMAVSEGVGPGWSGTITVAVDPYATRNEQPVAIIMNETTFTPNMDQVMPGSVLKLCTIPKGCIEGTFGKEWTHVNDKAWVGIFLFDPSELHDLIEQPAEGNLVVAVVLGNERVIRIPTDLIGLRALLKGAAPSRPNQDATQNSETPSAVEVF